jgi:Na+-driven multidrug efflux pump
MEIKIKTSEYLWGYFGYFYKYGMRFLTLPFVWHYLDRSQLDIWFVFLSISAFVGLLDFGFSPNIVRAVTYAFSGAKELRREGVSEETTGEGANYVLLAALISACKKVYAAIAAVALLLLSTAGTWYLWEISEKIVTPDFPFEKILIVWFLFLFGTVIDIYFKYIGVLVGGRGLVGVTQKFNIASSLVSIGLTFIVLFLGYGLLGTVAVGLVMTLATRIFFGYLFFHKIDKDLTRNLAEARKSPEKPVVLRNIWSNTWKMGLNSLGIFGFYQLPVLLSGVCFEKSYITEVGITLQIFNMLNMVSSAWFNMSSPRYASLAVLKKTDVLRREFLQAVFIGLALYIAGFLALFFFGYHILHFLGKDKVLLPSAGVLLLYGAVFLMEVIHGKCATFLTNRNIVPFLPATLLTSAASIGLTALFVTFTDWGVAAFPLATLCANLVYNSWYWPLRVARDFEFSWRDFKPKDVS